MKLKFYPSFKVVDTIEEGEEYLEEKWGYEEMWREILWMGAMGLISQN